MTGTTAVSYTPKQSIVWETLEGSFSAGRKVGRSGLVWTPNYLQKLKVSGVLPEFLKRKNEAMPQAFIGGRRGPRSLKKAAKRKSVRF